MDDAKKQRKAADSEGTYLTRRSIITAGTSLAIAAIPLVATSQTDFRSSKRKKTIAEEQSKILEMTKANLPSDALQALPRQLNGLLGDTARRNSHPLPENSEPYIVFEASGKKVRKWA